MATNSSFATPSDKRSKPYVIPRKRMQTSSSLDESYIDFFSKGQRGETQPKCKMQVITPPPVIYLDEDAQMETASITLDETPNQGLTDLISVTVEERQNSSPRINYKFDWDQQAQTYDPFLYMDVDEPDKSTKTDGGEPMDWEPTCQNPPSKKGKYLGFCKRISSDNAARLRVIYLREFGGVNYVGIRNHYVVKSGSDKGMFVGKGHLDFKGVFLTVEEWHTITLPKYID